MAHCSKWVVTAAQQCVTIGTCQYCSVLHKMYRDGSMPKKNPLKLNVGMLVFTHPFLEFTDSVTVFLLVLCFYGDLVHWVENIPRYTVVGGIKCPCMM